MTKSMYERSVSPEAYDAHVKRMRNKSRERSMAKRQGTIGEEGNISDADIPSEIAKQRNSQSGESK